MGACLLQLVLTDFQRCACGSNRGAARSVLTLSRVDLAL